MVFFFSINMIAINKGKSAFRITGLNKTQPLTGC